MSLKDAASALGVPESTYRDWENGRSIQGEPYPKMAEVFQVPLGVLFGLDPEGCAAYVQAEMESIMQHIFNIRRRIGGL